MEPPSRTPPGPPAQRGKGRATAKCRRLRKGSGDTVRFRCCYEISGSCRDLADGHGRFARAPRPDSPRVRHKSLTWNTSPCRARPLTGAGPGLATSGSPRAANDGRLFESEDAADADAMGKALSDPHRLYLKQFGA